MSKSSRRSAEAWRARSCARDLRGSAPMSREEALRHADALGGWEVAQDGRSMSKLLVLKDFLSAVGLIKQIAALAEVEDHHPDLHLTAYKKLTIELSTHAIGGLSENDFILAAKIDALQP